VLPEVRDYWMPWEGVFHNITVMSFEKEYPGHARRLMSAIWGQGQMSFCKVAVLVDGDVSLKNPSQLLRTILEEVDLEKDLYVSEGILDVLDHSAPEPLFGGKLGVDATRRFPDEKERGPRSGPPTSLPDPSAIHEALREASPLVTGFHAPDLPVRNRPLLLRFAKDGTSTGRELAEKLLSHPGLTAFSLFVLCDDFIDLEDGSLVLWKAFNNIDPKRDIVRSGARAVFDATRKGPEDGHHRPWPDDIVMDPEVVERLKKRASELGIARWIRG
jgi:4-hydroxy-3-polyprenylbenzoate decarboxylase